SEETANLVYDKLVGFSGFGFPKSHAAAFGLLAYQSAWLRHHHPAEFLAALLNAQPMGFYPPASLVRDAQRRGVETLPPDVNESAAACRVEDGKVRIGLAYVHGIGDDEADTVGAHPIEPLRPHLPPGTLTSDELGPRPHGSRVAFAGMAVARQRPATANGVVFMLLEDELGQVNLIVAPQVYDRFRALVRGEPLLLVRGRFAHYDRNRNVVVRELATLTPLARRAAGRGD